MLAPQAALNEIGRLGFPPIFQRIWADEFPHGFFSVCQRPRRFFRLAADIEGRLPRFKACVPLWEENGDRIVAFDKATGEFISLYYEDLDCKVMGSTYQQFISSFFFELVYSGVVDQLPELSELFMYRHLTELQQWAKSDDKDSCEESEQRFLESIKD